MLSDECGVVGDSVEVGERFSVSGEVDFEKELGDGVCGFGVVIGVLGFNHPVAWETLAFMPGR